jgi:hypothetical protein
MTVLNMISEKHRKRVYNRGETLTVHVKVSAKDYPEGYKMCGKKVVNGKWVKYNAGPVRKCWSGLVKARKS